MDIIKFSDFNLNESMDSNKISFTQARKLVSFYKKIEPLFKDIKLNLSYSKIKELALTGNKEKLFESDDYKKIKKIIDDNKNEIQKAYDEVFGMKEEICFSSLLVSVIFALAFYYAFSRGWFNKLFSKVDGLFGKPKTLGSYGGCSSCEDDGGGWSAPKKLGPKKKELNIDAILDKIEKKGIRSLTPEEKEFLDRKKKTNSNNPVQKKLGPAKKRQNISDDWD